MNAFVIAATSLRRYLRDRTALFFVVVLPVVVIVIVGATATGFDRFRVAVVDEDGGPLAVHVVAALGESSTLDVSRYDTRDAAATAARRGEVSVAVVIPRGFDAGLRRGDDQQIAVLGDQTNSSQQAAWSAVASVVAAEAARVQAARFATAQASGTLDDNLGRADAAAPAAGRISVDARSVDATRRYLPEGFSYSAPTMLVLFVFVNSLAGGGAIIESRRLGMYERVSAAPVSTRSIVAGETLCYLAMALLQSLLIVGVGAIGFGVDWGDPAAALVLIATWALVGTGAGVLSGTLFRTPEQAASIGPSVGIAFGMLGGCMWPLEIVPDAMRTAGHFVPHAWAIDAWTNVLSRGGGLFDIGRQVLVLLAFALVLLMISTQRLRHRIAA